MSDADATIRKRRDVEYAKGYAQGMLWIGGSTTAALVLDGLWIMAVMQTGSLLLGWYLLRRLDSLAKHDTYGR